MNFKQAVKFSPLISNKFWDRICLINDKHVTASQQYLMLMQDLENQGVKFTEIMEFLLNEADVACVPGSAFGAPGYVRFSFACSMEMLEESVRRIKRAVMA